MIALIGQWDENIEIIEDTEKGMIMFEHYHPESRFKWEILNYSKNTTVLEALDTIILEQL
jgi:hypothetical protein